MSSNGRFTGRRALVTGAAGFIGRAACAALESEGAEVIGADVHEGGREAVEATGARFTPCDVRDPAAVTAALDGVDLVLHTAAFIHEGGAMEEFVDLNLRGTVNLLDRAAEAGVDRVVHLSSVVVYGYEDPGTQDEEAPLRTYGVPYLDTKSSSDRVARRRGAVVIRPGDVYGPGSVPWTRRPLELAAEGRLMVPSSTARMLPVYVDDLVEACLAGADRGERGRAYTAWSGEDVTFKDFFNRLVGPAGGRCTVIPRGVLEPLAVAAERWDALRGRPPRLGARALTFVDRRGSVSNERIRTELGWEPRVDLDEGMRRIRLWASGEGLI